MKGAKWGLWLLHRQNNTELSCLNEYVDTSVSDKMCKILSHILFGRKCFVIKCFVSAKLEMEEFMILFVCLSGWLQWLQIESVLLRVGYCP